MRNDTSDHRESQSLLRSTKLPSDKNACLIILILSQYKMKCDAKTVYIMVRNTKSLTAGILGTLFFPTFLFYKLHTRPDISQLKKCILKNKNFSGGKTTLRKLGVTHYQRAHDFVSR